MKSSVEPLEGNKVKLYIEVEEDEFDRDIDRAFKTIAREVRLPGFRNGKAPRRVLEARIGIGPAREQALRDSIPQYLAKAVREHDVDIIATPQIEITGGQEEGPVEFDATIEIRPEITVPGYGGLRVELPSPDATDEEIEAVIEGELRRAGSLDDVDRPAATGDFVTVDLSASRDGDEVAGLNTEDWSYEIGQGWVAEGFDDELIGASAGDELSFTATPKGTEQPAEFTVSVQRVQELVVPELDDEFVAENLGEFETVDEWRASIAQRISTGKLNRIRQQLIPKVTEALTGLTDIEAPTAMVESDLQSRVQNTVRQFSAQGIDLEGWLAATGQDSNSFIEGLRVQSQQAVKADLALRAVAVAEAIEIGDADIEAEYARIAMQVGQKAKDVRKAYERNDAVPELVAQLRKSKALDWLLHHVEIVDPDGKPIDRELVLGHTHDDDEAGGHDHGAAGHEHGEHGEHEHEHGEHEHHEHEHEHEHHEHEHDDHEDPHTKGAHT